MLNEMIDMMQCPVCGRMTHHGQLRGWWCPYCGDSLTTSLRKELRLLTDRISIIEKLLEWNQIQNLDEIINNIEENNP